VAGSCKYYDEPAGSGAMLHLKFVFMTACCGIQHIDLMMKADSLKWIILTPFLHG
jgi:hypothetical protein